MSKHRKNESLLDESAILGSGALAGFSFSQYIKLRKELFRAYTKNAYYTSNKKFSKIGYKRFSEQYLKDINKLRTSPIQRDRVRAILKDIKHFNPKYLTKESRALLKTKGKMTKDYYQRLQKTTNLNKKSFYKIAPKRVAFISAGIAGATALPALAYRYQNKKNWKEEGKKTFLQMAAPFTAGVTSYGFYKAVR